MLTYFKKPMCNLLSGGCCCRHFAVNDAFESPSLQGQMSLFALYNPGRSRDSPNNLRV